MNPSERRAALGLAGIYGFRMLGLFLILPVFALYAETLPNVTPWLVGIAIGIYGLTQALLQIPFGLLSDKIGRKPMIVIGLLLFALGSVVAAMATDIYTIILGRAVQGSGAIAAVVMALAADLTRDSQRTKAMAFIGMTIGVSFMLALISGPYLYAWIDVPGIFWLTGLFALIGILIVVFLVPTPTIKGGHGEGIPVPAAFRRILTDSTLLRLDLGIFCLHLILTSLFLAMPLVLRDAGLPLVEHSWLYLLVLVVSIVLMVPFIILAEKKGQMKPVYLGAVLVLMLAQVGLFFMDSSLLGLGIFLGVFFVAFNLLEATLPSLVSKAAPADAKGTAMGVYSTAQFMGAFLGGFIGGWVNMHYGLNAVFIFSAAVALIWLVLTFSMKFPGRFGSYLLRVGILDMDEAQALAERLDEVDGVMDVVVVAADGVAFLKIEKDIFDEANLDWCRQ